MNVQSGMKFIRVFFRVSFRWAQTQDGVPTPRANELSMTAAQHLEDADLALEILATAKAKAKDSPTMHAIAIKMLAETGRLEEANDILQVHSPGSRWKVEA